jgi:hypothetical protein
MLSLSETYDKYFKGKPASTDIEKATFAYHWTHVDHQNGHHWLSGHFDHKSGDMPDSIRFEKCLVCGRIRNDVRWDDLPAHCNNVGRYTIGEVLYREEQQFLAMLDRAQHKIPDILAKRFRGELTAEALFFLQSSVGYPPDVIAMFVEQNLEPLMPEFDRLMEEHQKKSGAFKGIK